MGVDDGTPNAVDDNGELTHKKSPGWWDRNWLKVCLVALFGWTSLGFYLGANEHTARVDQAIDFSQDLRSGLVSSCDKNGNPLREAVQRILENEIEQSQSPILHEFFPQIPSSRLDELIQDANKERREIIAEIAPVNCEKQYPHVEK